MRKGFDKRTGLIKRGGFKSKTGFNKKTGLNSNGIDKAKLKRNGLKQRKRKQQRQSSPLQREIHKCDIAFSQLVRLSHADKQGKVKCFTCNKKGFWKKDGIECGHYKSRSHLKTRWMSLNAAPQCTYCNQVLNGNIKKYRMRLIEGHGDEILNYLDQESATVVNPTTADVRSLRLKIEKKVKQIRQEKGL